MRAIVLLGVTLLVGVGLSTGPARAAVPDLEVTNLYDAFGRVDGVAHDWGFSALIRHRGRTILFDAGTDPAKLRQNATALGVDLAEVDIMVCSHPHRDHFGGFAPALVERPKATVYIPDAGFDEGPLAASPRAVRVRSTKEVAPGVTLVVTAAKAPYTFSELSLVLDTDEGPMVFTGCSHSSVERIVRAVNDATGARVRLLAGGYHLFRTDPDEVRAVAGRLKKLGVRKLAPAHCTGKKSARLLRETFGADVLFFGLGEKLTVRASSLERATR